MSLIFKVPVVYTGIPNLHNFIHAAVYTYIICIYRMAEGEYKLFEDKPLMLTFHENF